MGNIKEKLFWERFRPNSMKPEKGKIPIILLPRVREFVEGGIVTNLVFNGQGGSGKSSCAGILCQDADFLKINCSLSRGIDVIREEIEDHVNNYSLTGNRGMKVVWLDEFDNTTPDMRKALRGFIEDNSDNARFIATTNNINEINRSTEDSALLGRFSIVDFDPVDHKEVEYLKKQQVAFLKSIAKNVSLDLSDDVIAQINDRFFPNFRKSVHMLQEVQISGGYQNHENTKLESDERIFDYVMDGDINLENIYYFVCDNYPKEKTEVLLKVLSRPLFKHVMANDPELLMKAGTKLMELSKEHNAQYTSTIDPETHLINYVIKLKELFKTTKV